MLHPPCQQMSPIGGLPSPKHADVILELSLNTNNQVEQDLENYGNADNLKWKSEMTSRTRHPKRRPILRQDKGE